MVGVAQIVDGVVHLVVGEGVVGLVATDETPEGLVLQMIVGLADVGLEIGGVADVIVPDVAELLDELVGEIDEGGVDAAAFDEVDDGEEEHSLMWRLHPVDLGDVEGGEEFGEGDDGWHGVVVLMGQRYGIYLTLPNVSAKKDEKWISRIYRISNRLRNKITVRLQNPLHNLSVAIDKK